MKFVAAVVEYSDFFSAAGSHPGVADCDPLNAFPAQLPPFVGCFKDPLILEDQMVGSRTEEGLFFQSEHPKASAAVQTKFLRPALVMEFQLKTGGTIFCHPFNDAPNVIVEQESGPQVLIIALLNGELRIERQQLVSNGNMLLRLFRLLFLLLLLHTHWRLLEAKHLSLFSLDVEHSLIVKNIELPV
jgi:hypothetical protein